MRRWLSVLAVVVLAQGVAWAQEEEQQEEAAAGPERLQVFEEIEVTDRASTPTSTVSAPAEPQDAASVLPGVAVPVPTRAPRVDPRPSPASRSSPAGWSAAQAKPSRN